MLPETVKTTRVVQALEAETSLADAVTGGHDALGELTLEIAADRILDVCRFLREKDQYNRLSAITCVDWYPMEPRFEVVYHLHSTHRNERVRLKAKIGGERPAIDSVYPVWKNSDWYEREVFDLFGVVFRGHPNLKRILMPDDWQGHPLRKDYPIHGHKYSYANE